jgi:hypothetical protein
MIDEAEFYSLQKRVNRLEVDHRRFEKKVRKAIDNCFQNDKTLWSHIEKLESKSGKSAKG